MIRISEFSDGPNEQQTLFACLHSCLERCYYCLFCTCAFSFLYHHIFLCEFQPGGLSVLFAGTEDNVKAQENLQKSWVVIEPNSEENGLFLFRWGTLELNT